MVLQLGRRQGRDITRKNSHSREKNTPLLNVNEKAISAILGRDFITSSIYFKENVEQLQLYKEILLQPQEFYFFSPGRMFRGGTRRQGTLVCSSDLRTLIVTKKKKRARSKEISTANLVDVCPNFYVPATGSVQALPDESIYCLFSVIFSGCAPLYLQPRSSIVKNKWMRALEWLKSYNPDKADLRTRLERQRKRTSLTEDPRSAVHITWPVGHGVQQEAELNAHKKREAVQDHIRQPTHIRDLLVRGSYKLLWSKRSSQPKICYLKCDDELEYLMWDQQKDGSWANRIRCVSIRSVTSGTSSGIFGLAKWGLSVNFAQPPEQMFSVSRSSRSSINSTRQLTRTLLSTASLKMGGKKEWCIHLAEDTQENMLNFQRCLRWLIENNSHITRPEPEQVKQVLSLDQNWKWRGSGLKDRFVIKERIGFGGCAEVFKVEAFNGDMAVKIFHETSEQLKSEISILKEVSEAKHPNLVQFFGEIPGMEDGNSGKTHLLMEFCEAGSLLDLLKKAREPLREEHIAYIIRCCLLALCFLHSPSHGNHKIVHRDIKSANILLTKNGGVKVTDFGISQTVKYGEPGVNVVAGSPLWMAPETLLGYSTIEGKSDVWSLGITALELAEGEPPHAHLTNFHEIVCAVNGNEAPSIESHCSRYTHWSEDFRSFVKQCLTRDIKQRPSAVQILKHRFVFTSDIDLDTFTCKVSASDDIVSFCSFIEHGTYTYAVRSSTQRPRYHFCCTCVGAKRIFAHHLFCVCFPF